ncbi:zinc finger protein basonuclin-2-like [Labrus mixtus]|uniref:zinc finger protein basonuclin-2-like n=1 Tax=Labrus mixtus TaxID=508554 RepID=UPI0029BFF087|nr:zinc finger protein basonuclin-2-like [Labrus mixtus]
MTPDTEESLRCSASSCSCLSFKAGSVQLRSCGICGHSWVAHACQKLQHQARPPSSCGPVEVALPGLVLDLSSLVLYGAQAVPVRLKILLDRLYSVLTPEQVEHILHTLGWSLGDYVRGYMLQFPVGKVLDRWLMVTQEEELLILRQFLRFGETRPIVELMTLHFLEPTTNISTFIGRDAGPAGEKNRRGSLGSDVCRFKKNNQTDHQNVPDRLSLLLPFHFPNSSFHLPTKDLDPQSKVTFLWKSNDSKPSERNNQERRREEEKHQIIKIKSDPDKPNLSRSAGHQKPWFQTDKDLQRSISKPETTSSPSPSKDSSFFSVPSPKFTQKYPGSSSLSPLPSFSSSFLCSLPTSSFPPSLHPPPSPLCTLPSLSPAGSRKGRVCCGVCGKSFYDKGTLKIHYNAVHLKIKHRCTVAGCTMVFSSLRSRNRHSANANPRLHTGTGRDANGIRNINKETRSSTLSDSLTHRDTNTQTCRKTETSNDLWKHDDAHSLREEVKHGSNPQQDDVRPRFRAPPPPPQTLSSDSSFTLIDSTNRSYPHTQAPPPPPLLPGHVASSLSPLVSPVNSERCHSFLLHHNKHPASITSKPAPLHDADPEEKQNKLTSEQRRWASGDLLPKKKPRKSSMPVKIERERKEEKES